MDESASPHGTSSTSERAAGFWSTVRRRIRPRDCVALAAVPLVLVGVFLLPESVRRSLAFTYRDPTLVTAYTAHFVHLSRTHLLANLVGYVLLAGGGYLFAAAAGARRLFALAVVTYLLALPFALSALNLAVPRNGVGYGFSGLNMALAGLFPVLLASYAGQWLHARVAVRHSPGAFLFAIAVVVALVLPSSPVAVAVGAAAALGSLAYAWTFVSTLEESDGGRYPRGTGPGWLDAFVLGVVLFVGYLFVGFPAELRTGAAVVNTYVHLLGFCLAFLVPYIGVELDVVDS